MTDSLLLLKNILFDVEYFLIPILLIIYWKRFEKKQFLKFYTIYQISDIFFVYSHILIHLSKAYFLKQIYLPYIKNISFIFAEFSCIILFLIFTNLKANLSVVFIGIKKLIKIRDYKLINGLLILSAISVPVILYGMRKILNSRRNEVFL